MEISLDSAKIARRNAVEQMLYRNLDLPVRLATSERALWFALMAPYLKRRPGSPL